MGFKRQLHRLNCGLHGHVRQQKVATGTHRDKLQTWQSRPEEQARGEATIMPGRQGRHPYPHGGRQGEAITGAAG